MHSGRVTCRVFFTCGYGQILLPCGGTGILVGRILSDGYGYRMALPGRYIPIVISNHPLTSNLQLQAIHIHCLHSILFQILRNPSSNACDIF